MNVTQTIEVMSEPKSGGDKMLGSLLQKRTDQPEAFKFGPYCLIPGRRLLLAGQERIEVGSRAFDILVLLVRRCGDVVSSRQIFDHAWPDMIVEGSNIRFQIRGLRRILSTYQRSIVTVRSRGYVFVVPVQRLSPMEAADEGKWVRLAPV
jgi:DNA-binding winged helix-turn-helix (wHTH) protein